MHNPSEPSLFRKFVTRLLNRLLRRKCRSCKYWRSFHHFETGTCCRTPFYPLCDEYSWKPACDYYDGKREVLNAYAPKPHQAGVEVPNV